MSQDNNIQSESSCFLRSQIKMEKNDPDEIRVEVTKSEVIEDNWRDFIWNVIIIALFYSVPMIQLVVNFLQVCITKYG